MNNLAYYLARLYYTAAHQSITAVPTGFTEEFWAERLYRLIAGFPDKMAGGKNTSFWLELLFYKKTNQTYRQATGTYPAWFWLSKLYAFYSGQRTDAILQPASAEFWADKLVNLSTFEAPAIRLTVNNISVSDGGTFLPANPVQGATVTYNGVISNPGTATLRLSNLTADGTIITIVSGLSSTDVPAGGTATFTIALSTASAGVKSGWFSVDTNISGTLATCTVNVGYTVIDYDAMNRNVIVWERWYRFREALGTVAENAMNPGTLDGTLNVTSLAQAGQLGAGEAISIVPGGKYVQTPASGLINGAAPATWRFLVYLNSAGETAQGRLVGKTSDTVLLTFGASSPYSVQASVFFSGGTLLVNWLNCLPGQSWQDVVFRINADNTLDLFINGTKQATSTAGSGTKSSDAAAFYLFNRISPLTRSFDGLCDEFAFKPAAVSDAMILQLAQLSGLAPL